MILPGTPVIASTLRQPAALAPGQTAGYATQLAGLTLRQIAGVLFQPRSGMSSPGPFDVELQQPAVVYADSPTTTSLQPVQVNDILVLPDGSQYVVAGAPCFVGQYVAI